MATTIFLVNPQTFPSTSYLLDTYTAAAAYSLRQLKTGVTNVVRVRRSSDNAESDFTADEITDGTLTTWTGANNGFVVTWYDQSGNGNDVTQSTAANQPQLVSSGSVLTKGGKPRLQFDGSNDSLRYNAVIAALDETADATICTVTSGDLANNSGPILSVSTGAPSTWLLVTHQNNLPHFTVDASVSGVVQTSKSTTYSIGVQILQIAVKDASGNSMASFDNGNTGTTNTWNGAYTNSILDLGFRSNNSSYFDGDYQELIIFDNDESANRTDIESDINGHYSIY